MLWWRNTLTFTVKFLHTVVLDLLYLLFCIVLNCFTDIHSYVPRAICASTFRRFWIKTRLGLEFGWVIYNVVKIQKKGQLFSFRFVRWLSRALNVVSYYGLVRFLKYDWSSVNFKICFDTEIIHLKPILNFFSKYVSII